jgi:serine/threonine-protein kinase
VIAGKYKLQRLIGEGATGAVYAAVHQFTGRHVALKVLDTAAASHEGFAARFLQEARSAAEIGHPAVCDVLDAGQDSDGALYLALELLEGRTLDEAIEARDLRQDEVVRIGIELLEGLAAAHDRGIVHRDIKPDNVFLIWDEQGEQHVKLLDFGVAKNTKSGGPEVFRTQQGAILGTPYYMSPEQAAGDPVDVRTDLWAAGAVLFHALTGRPPFDEDSYNRLIAKLLTHTPPRLREVLAEAPEWLALVVDRALEPSLAARWQSARSMADALRRRGGGELELDWAPHEDATVRSDSTYDAGEDTRPALLASSETPTIEVDFDVTTAQATLRDDEAEAILRAAGDSDRPRLRRRAVFGLGLTLGVLVTAVAALVAGYLLFGGSG